MRALFLVSTISITLMAQSIFGHGDHKEMKKEEATLNAKTQIEKLITEEKLPESWRTASIVTTETANVSGKKRWVVVFENSKELDASKKKLEVVLTPAGKFVGHQFSK